MCGINGIISLSNENLNREIQLMNKNLVHRGPDGSGILKFHNLYLGHTRLSIQDLTTKGSQPMSNDGNLWIIFNGEIYNFKEIRENLKTIGYKFYSETDTEVILNSYKEWGKQCFLKFNGMWSLALLDKKKEEIIISRDRYGVKPCYIYKNSKQFIFSSEIKAILSVTNDSIDPNKRLMEEKKLEGYFTTAYEKIDILEPGHFLKIKLNPFIIESERWWKGLDHLFEVSPDKNKVKEILKEKLQKSVKRRLISDVKISTSLSGGLDSSIIFKELNNQKSNSVSLNPFIVNYDGNITFDKAINLTKTMNKNPIIIDGESKMDFDDIIDTFGSIEKKELFTKQIELYKAQKKHGFKVSIDGHGADECLAGYVDNLKDISISLHNNLVDSFKSIFEIERYDIDKILKNNFLTKIDYKINTFVDNFFELQKPNFTYSEPNLNINPPNFLKEDLIQLQTFDFSFQSLYIKSNFGFLQWLLNKWDRASMSQSIEVRSPYLDWEFFQYALCIPGYLKVNNGRNKAILRDAYSEELPKEIIYDHQKQGLLINNKSNHSEIVFTNARNDKTFKESNSWDSTRILKDFEIDFFKTLNNPEVIKILDSYAYDLGMKKKLINELDSEYEFSENFNLLN